MSLLDMLFGGAPASDQPAPSAVPTANSLAAPAQDVTVTAPHSQTQAPKPGAYDNTPELQAIAKVENSYPQGAQGPGQGSHLGLSNMIPDAMPGAGTLRNILGTLGDAFLIQSGHQPIHAQQNYNREIANAAAGFDNDPAGAAARIAATGAPGSLDEAQKMYDVYQTQQLRKAQQQSNNDYRQSNVDIRQQQADSQTQARQAQVEDRTRQAVGGMMKAAAETGDPKLYSAARNRAVSLASSRIKDFDPDTEIPANLSEYGAGYGMNAGQVARQETSRASIAERANAADQRDATTRRGQDLTAGANKARVGATYAGQSTSMAGQLKALEAKQNQGVPLTASEQAIWNRGTHINNGGGAHLTIPGLTVPGGAPGNLAPPHPNGTIQTTTPQQSQHASGPIHTYPSGRRAQWNGRAWVPIS